MAYWPLISVIAGLIYLFATRKDQNRNENFSSHQSSPENSSVNPIIETCLSGFQKSKFHRLLASRYSDKRNEFFKLSQHAFRAGNHAKAKKHSFTANKYAELMDLANKRATDAAFAENNSKKSQRAHEIDLHGLFVHEAIERLEERVNSAMQNGFPHLIVVTGQGVHSENGPKIKPAGIKFAEDEEIVYRLDCPNAGCIRFDIAE